LTLGVNSFSESPANIFISFCPSLTVLFNISSTLLSYTDQVLVHFLEIANLGEISEKKSFCQVIHEKYFQNHLQTFGNPKVT